VHPPATRGQPQPVRQAAVHPVPIPSLRRRTFSWHAPEREAAIGCGERSPGAFVRNFGSQGCRLSMTGGRVGEFVVLNETRRANVHWWSRSGVLKAVRPGCQPGRPHVGVGPPEGPIPFMGGVVAPRRGTHSRKSGFDGPGLGVPMPPPWSGRRARTASSWCGPRPADARHIAVLV